MAGQTGRRTQVEALDALTAEVRAANLLTVLQSGTLLEHDEKGEQSPVAKTAERARRKNAIRAELRAHFGIEVAS